MLCSNQLAIPYMVFILWALAHCFILILLSSVLFIATLCVTCYFLIHFYYLDMQSFFLKIVHTKSAVIAVVIYETITATLLQHELN